MTGHQHEKWQMQEHPDGGVYCAACGERPDPVKQALKNYRAAVDVVRSAEYVKRQAAQALYEARQTAKIESDLDDLDPETVTVLKPGDPGFVTFEEHLPRPGPFRTCIAREDVLSSDGRVILMDAVDWQIGTRVPLTSSFEGGLVIGSAKVVEVSGRSVTAEVHVDPESAEGRLIFEGTGRISLGVGLDHVEADVDNGASPTMTITSGRLRQVAVQPPEQACWPECVVSLDG